MTPASATGWPSSLKPAAPASASSTCSVELGALLARRDRGEEADPHGGLLLAALEQRLEHRRGVHDRRGVRHGHDGRRSPRGGGRGCRWRCPRGPRARACAGGRGGRRTRGRRPGPRVDLLEALRRAADAPVAHDQVADLVDAGRRVEDADAAQDERGGRAGPLDEPGSASDRRPRRSARPARRRRGLGEQVVEDRHAHDHPVGRLALDQGGGVVGQGAGDLDAAVDRAGVHDALAGAQSRVVDAVGGGVLAQRGHEAARPIRSSCMRST